MLLRVQLEAKRKKYVIMMIGLMIFFLGIYTFLDFEGNENYNVMAENLGWALVLLHIGINVIIANLSAVMVTFSIINYDLNKAEPVGSNAIPFFTFIFGLLTFGCTGCVVAFFSAVGIAFTPILLPAGNLLWKLAALLITVLGFLWIMYSIQNNKCKVKLPKTPKEE